MVKITLVCFLFASFISCSVNKSEPAQFKEEGYSWFLSNDELKEQIVDYFQTVDTGDTFQNNVLYLGVTKEDSIYINYSIRYVTSSSFFVHGYTHMIIDVEGHPVCVYFNCEDPFFPAFKLSNESIIELMKAYFPEDYQYYKSAIKDFKRDSDYYENEFQFRDALPVPSTWAPESWVLTFKDGKMIDKKIKR